MLPARFLNTIRYLKPGQIVARPGFWLKRKLLGPGSSGNESLIARDLKRLYHSMVVKNFNLTLLNVEVSFDPLYMQWKSQDWQLDERPEKLWVYQLNYFSWLFSQKTEIAQELQLYLILDWIEKNNSTREETWEPFALSKRVCNWVKWLETHKELVEPIRTCIDASIYSQCHRLTYDLEYHNQANHLFENFRALFIACLHLLRNQHEMHFKLISWLTLATENLIEQINEQFFADGGHYERSPMYHIDMLEAVEEIFAAAKEYAKFDFVADSELLKSLFSELIELCHEKLPLMKDWLSNLTHPDGFIALINDSTLLPGLKQAESNDKPTSYLLEESGFFIRRWNNNYFILNCGEPSPAFQPGHSHCDILSFELSINKTRCIVDTGCGSYQNPEIRRHCRRTSSHNLPLIELSEQSDIWGAFRMGKRAKILHRSFDSQNALLIVEFADQYDQRFRREILFESRSIKIRDRMYDRRITGTFCSLIHLHPDTQILASNESNCLELSRNKVEFKIKSTARLRSEPHRWYPDFGKVEKSEKLILSNHLTEAIDYVISW
jgi:uncharacterized heparinase superfamily protein